MKGHIIVADALNCQKETAKIIKEGKGDYLLSVKGNQPLLKADIEEYVQDEILRKQMDTACKSEKNRERVEKRTAFCTTNLGWMDNTDEWEGVKLYWSYSFRV
ncbi:ISAs1 family transposase [Treponema denticola]|uniref:ISAs1 family transposase n=1 Tax=Treponema denticola TaxID=158 RepID=UPI00351CB98E